MIRSLRKKNKKNKKIELKQHQNRYNGVWHFISLNSSYYDTYDVEVLYVWC